MSDDKKVTLDGATVKELGEAMVAAFKKEWPNLADSGCMSIEFRQTADVENEAYELRAGFQYHGSVYVPKATLGQRTLEDKAWEAESLGRAMRETIAKLASECTGWTTLAAGC